MKIKERYDNSLPNYSIKQDGHVDYNHLKIANKNGITSFKRRVDWLTETAELERGIPVLSDIHCR